MQVQILKSKIHCARVTDSNLHYEGSLGVDLDLLDAANIFPYEKILVVNANNGERLETYAIPGKRGSRTVCLNGAAARKGEVGDLLTIMAFATVEAEKATKIKPRILVLDQDNRICRRKQG